MHIYLFIFITDKLKVLFIVICAVHFMILSLYWYSMFIINVPALGVGAVFATCSCERGPPGVLSGDVCANMPGFEGG